MELSDFVRRRLISDRVVSKYLGKQKIDVDLDTFRRQSTEFYCLAELSKEVLIGYQGKLREFQGTVGLLEIGLVECGGVIPELDKGHYTISFSICRKIPPRDYVSMYGHLGERSNMPIIYEKYRPLYQVELSGEHRRVRRSVLFMPSFQT